MILEIPTSEEFYTSGKELLNFAWDTVVELLIDLDGLEDYGVDSHDAEEISDACWKLSKRHLTTALSITQQGVEFILKGKIIDVSPFILIAGDPEKQEQVRWQSLLERESVQRQLGGERRSPIDRVIINPTFFLIKFSC